MKNLSMRGGIFKFFAGCILFFFVERKRDKKKHQGPVPGPGLSVLPHLGGQSLETLRCGHRKPIIGTLERPIRFDDTS